MVNNWTYNPNYLPSIKDLNLLRQKGLWNDFIHNNPLGMPFQILTQEFINSFSSFVLQIIQNINNENINIMELGASNGRLTHFLKQFILQQPTSKSISFKAIDDFSWDKRFFATGDPIYIKKIFEVTNMSVATAMKENPNIVITSWMPHNEDWTEHMRKNPSVEIFILIGNENDCGNQYSWSSDTDFERIDMNIEGSICWEDIHPEQKTSYVSVFLRRKF